MTHYFRCHNPTNPVKPIVTGLLENTSDKSDSVDNIRDVFILKVE